MADWRSELCTYIGAPITSQNLFVFDLWTRSEAQPTYKHNPLGARPFDDDKQEWASQEDVFDFTDIQRATAYYSHLLHQPRFDPIQQAFRGSSWSGTHWRAIHNTQWRPSHYQSGHYPVLLYRQAFSPLDPVVSPLAPLTALSHDLFHAWHNLAHELHHHSPRQLTRARHWTRRMHSAVR